MKKPVHQSIIEKAIAIFGSIAGIAVIINNISNATGRMGYKIGLALVALLFLFWGFLLCLVKMGKIKWTIDGGHTLRATKLGKDTNYYFIFTFLILGVYTGFDGYKNGLFSDDEVEMEYRVFRPDDPYFKLLILPWEKECDFEGKRYDIGLVIKKRLEDMVRRDSIGLHLYYLDDSSDYRNFNTDSFRAMMKYNNANMIIHGYYSFSACEGGLSDKICYMYQTNFNKAEVEVNGSGDAYAMRDLHGLGDVRDGAGQENIDFIIHWVAAMSEFRNQNIYRAIRLFEKIKGYEQNEDVVFQLSNCYYKMKDYGRTKVLLERVLQINPNNAEASVHLCMLLIKEGKGDRAKNILAKQLATHPRDIDVLRDLCLMYRVLKDTTRSDSCLGLLLKEVPESDSNYKNLGTVYKDIKNYQKSKQYFEKAFKVCSRHADDWNAMGTAYMLLKDTVKAKPYFTKALEINGRSVTALYNCGILFYREKAYGKAGECLQKAFSINPTDENLLEALGDNYRAMGQMQPAVEYFEKALAINPVMVRALVNVSVCYMNVKKFSEANRHLDRLLAYCKDDPGLLDKLALLCIQRDNFGQAELYYKKLLICSPGNAAALYNLAHISGCQRNGAKAMKLLSRALSSMPALRDAAKKDRAFDCIRADKQFIAMTE